MMRPLDQRARHRVFERDGYKCVACGTNYMLTIQHRINKGMGGSRLYDGMDHLVTMCQPCNVRLESDAEFAELGRENGWKLYRNRATSPSQVPVFYAWESTWRLLMPDGARVTPLDEPAF